MNVVVVYPDDSSASVSLPAARRLCVARPELRIHIVIWDGTIAMDPYLRQGLTLERRQNLPALVGATSPIRIRTIQSVHELPNHAQIAICHDAVQSGLVVAARKWNVSRSTVQKVMQLHNVSKRKRKSAIALNAYRLADAMLEARTK